MRALACAGTARGARQRQVDANTGTTSSMSEAVVIIGGGQAGAQLALSLRQGGHAGAITIVGQEGHLPYQRPPLSKQFLAEFRDPSSLYLRPESFWREKDVALALGAAAAAIEPRLRRVTLSDGREIAYGTLVLATGTSARTLALPGIALPGVFSLRKIDDVIALRPALDGARRVVIVGGGYIGLEVASVVVSEGRDVAVLEAEDR